MFVKTLIFSLLLCTSSFAEESIVQKPLEVVDKVDELETQGQRTDFQSIDQKQELRDQWENLLGYDIWYPYFALKGIEDYISSSFHLPYDIKLRLKSSHGRIEVKFIKEF
jgi:hypothetical protein